MHPAALWPENAAEGRRPSKFTAGATGAAVFAVCLAYAGWSLLAGRSEESPSPEAGVALGEGSSPAPVRALPPEASPPVARLTLDEGIEFAPSDVTNAHLEVATDVGPGDIEPTVQQLGFRPQMSDDRPGGAVGAWLTGGIEPAPPQSPFPR
jgi:hypothetical protein